MHKKIKCPNNIFVLDIKFSKYTPHMSFKILIWAPCCLLFLELLGEFVLSINKKLRN